MNTACNVYLITLALGVANHTLLPVGLSKLSIGLCAWLIFSIDRCGQLSFRFMMREINVGQRQLMALPFFSSGVHFER